MLNNTIKSFIVSKNLSPSKFADEIGVQRSSISHILSGRNKPSLDIVQKIIRRYPEIGTDWLLEEPPAPEPVRQPVAAAPASNANGSAGQPVPRDNRTYSALRAAPGGTRALRTRTRTISYCTCCVRAADHQSPRLLQRRYFWRIFPGRKVGAASRYNHVGQKLE
jgi:transcriptional regulator with XRE-family HTH domain